MKECRNEHSPLFSLSEAAEQENDLWVHICTCVLLAAHRALINLVPENLVLRSLLPHTHTHVS